MPIVVNSNASATEASFNLSRNNEALRKSLGRLSSGKRISNPADDAGGLAVAYKLDSTINRSYATIQNAQNSLSYLQVQDSSLATVGKILDRMAELRTMAQDITKNSGDIENYSKEFIELQSQLRQIKEEKFNGISLFAVHTGTAAGSKAQMTKADNGGVYVDASGASIAYNKFGRELVTHPSGNTGNGSISLNVVNLQFVLSLNGSANVNVNLGGIGHTNSGITTTGLGDDEDYFITRIRDVSVSEIINAIEKLADARAENGAEQNRIMNSINLLQTNVTNLEAAHGRIMDADIALESTRFARYNVLVQASAAMTAQANQMTNIALSLLG